MVLNSTATASRSQDVAESVAAALAALVSMVLTMKNPAFPEHGRSTAQARDPLHAGDIDPINLFDGS
jgi:hypothetical protein